MYLTGDIHGNESGDYSPYGNGGREDNDGIDQCCKRRTQHGTDKEINDYYINNAITSETENNTTIENATFSERIIDYIILQL